MGPDAGELGLEGGEPLTQYSRALSLRHEVKPDPEQRDSENRGDPRAEVERAMEGVVHEQQDGESRCDHPPSGPVRHSPGARFRAAGRALGSRQQSLPDLRRAIRVHGPGWREVEGGQQRVLNPRERTCALLALPEVNQDRSPPRVGQHDKTQLELLMLSIKRVHGALSLRMDNDSLSF